MSSRPVLPQAFFPHPDYRTNRNYHDIALVQLERRIENEPDVNPICLNDDLSDLPEDTVLTAEGYGIIDLDRKSRHDHCAYYYYYYYY